MCARRRSAGFSLIEVVVFIVVLGIAFVGMLILYNRVTSASVDPMVRKQALAIASSLLEEIELRAYTFCDPDDPNVYTATSTVGCTGAAYIENIGPDTLPSSSIETRYSTPRFDNVNDYDGFRMGSGETDPNVRTAANAIITELANYKVVVAVAQIAANELGTDVPTTEALRITVTATHVPTGIATSLQGYRVRYAPNSP
jgi:MSHA pilin protein MshD